VLIIDDEPQAADILRDVLRSLGYDSVWTGDGAEGVRLAASYAPHVILLDHDLPDGSAAHALAHLNRDHPQIPVVLVTGQRDELLAHVALELRAVAYVWRPFDVDALHGILKAAVMRGQRG
jgi:DNA-binding response OmpR family regulator